MTEPTSGPGPLRNPFSMSESVRDELSQSNYPKIRKVVASIMSLVTLPLSIVTLGHIGYGSNVRLLGKVFSYPKGDAAEVAEKVEEFASMDTILAAFSERSTSTENPSQSIDDFLKSYPTKKGASSRYEALEKYTKTLALEHDQKGESWVAFGNMSYAPNTALKSTKGGIDEPRICAHEVEVGDFKCIISSHPNIKTGKAARQRPALHLSTLFERGVNYILNLTNNKDQEQGCRPYCTSEGTEFNDNEMRVKITDGDGAKYNAEVDGEKYEFTHESFTQWPDFGVPKASDINNIITKARALSKQEHAVVHCRAGVGRAGTFYILAAIIKDIDTNGKENWKGAEGKKKIARFILEGRPQRAPELVQTWEQLQFIEQAVSVLTEEKTVPDLIKLEKELETWKL